MCSTSKIRQVDDKTNEKNNKEKTSINTEKETQAVSKQQNIRET